jgi:hypothetical protein
MIDPTQDITPPYPHQPIPNYLTCENSDDQKSECLTCTWGLG